MIRLGLRCTAFAKSLGALNGFDLYTDHKLSSNETTEPGFVTGAAGCEARTLSIVLCGPPYNVKLVIDAMTKKSDTFIDSCFEPFK